MSQIILNKVADVDTADSNWISLYKIGGVAALIALLGYLLDVIISISRPDPGLNIRTAVDWFVLLQSDPLYGLRLLGLINCINMIVMLPMFLALYTAHRELNKAYATLALIFCLVGTAIYIAGNAAIPMLELSKQYVTSTDAQKTLLAAVGEGILARGEDFTPGSFLGFITSELATIIISLVMLQGRIFSKAASYTGILGCVFLTICTIWATFVPVGYNISMLFGMIGGLFMLAWYILVAIGMFRLEHIERKPVSQ